MLESGIATVLTKEIRIGLWRTRPKMHTVEQDNVWVYAGFRAESNVEGRDDFPAMNSFNDHHLDILRYDWQRESKMRTPAFIHASYQGRLQRVRLADLAEKFSFG